MEKDIKKESEKLFAKIKAHTPKLVEYLVTAATYWAILPRPKAPPRAFRHTYM